MGTMSTFKATVLLRNFRYLRIISGLGHAHKSFRPLTACALHTTSKDSCNIPQTTTEPEAQPGLYDAAIKNARDKPDRFWGELAEDLVWTKKWDKVLDASNPVFPKWWVFAWKSWFHRDLHADDP
jgi:hypothetical protein